MKAAERSVGLTVMLTTTPTHAKTGSPVEFSLTAYAPHAPGAFGYQLYTVTGQALRTSCPSSVLWEGGLQREKPGVCTIATRQPADTPGRERLRQLHQRSRDGDGCGRRAAHPGPAATGKWLTELFGSVARGTGYDLAGVGALVGPVPSCSRPQRPRCQKHPLVSCLLAWYSYAYGFSRVRRDV